MLPEGSARMPVNKSLFLVLAIAVGMLGGPALGEDQPPAEPNDDVRICEAYGPGYAVVPGTTTCVRINGFVRQDLNISGGGSGSPPSSAPPSQN